MAGKKKKDGPVVTPILIPNTAQEKAQAVTPILIPGEVVTVESSSDEGEPPELQPDGNADADAEKDPKPDAKSARK